MSKYRPTCTTLIITGQALIVVVLTLLNDNGAVRFLLRHSTFSIPTIEKIAAAQALAVFGAVIWYLRKSSWMPLGLLSLIYLVDTLLLGLSVDAAQTPLLLAYGAPHTLMPLHAIQFPKRSHARLTFRTVILSIGILSFFGTAITQALLLNPCYLDLLQQSLFTVGILTSVSSATLVMRVLAVVTAVLLADALLMRRKATSIFLSLCTLLSAFGLIWILGWGLFPVALIIGAAAFALLTRAIRCGNDRRGRSSSAPHQETR